MAVVYIFSHVCDKVIPSLCTPSHYLHCPPSPSLLLGTCFPFICDFPDIDSTVPRSLHEHSLLICIHFLFEPVFLVRFFPEFFSPCGRGFFSGFFPWGLWATGPLNFPLFFFCFYFGPRLWFCYVVFVAGCHCITCCLLYIPIVILFDDGLWRAQQAVLHSVKFVRYMVPACKGACSGSNS